MASALITTPFRRSANVVASADFPLAVGPATTMTDGRPSLPRSSGVSIVAPLAFHELAMSLVLTLTADPATAALEDSIVARVREALAAEGGAPSPARWLAPRIACDIALPQGSRAAVADIARRALGGAPVDIAASVAIGRRKTLLVADMESTLIENEMLDELAARAGIGDQVAAITRRTMNGELDFEASFRERIAMLRGAPARWLDEAKARIRVVSGATTLVRTMR